MMMKLPLLVFLLSTAVSAQWIKQTVNTTASFRGLSVVNEKVVWASGTGGTVIRTIDGGKVWKVMAVPGAEKLDFRDIEAFDANTAYILSIGNGESSRIYKTTDGGATWKLEFQNSNPKAFLDAIECESSSACTAMSDPVESRFLLVQSYIFHVVRWRERFIETPNAIDGEASFAASGTCLYTNGNIMMIATGGSVARILRSEDFGRTWAAIDTPVIKGSSGSGIFSISMYDSKYGVIVGGNYEKPNEATDNLAFTTDGGETWRLGNGLSGYRSAVTYVSNKMIIAVGTNGTDISRDGGKTWKKTGNEDLNAVAAKGKKAVWAVGPKGMVAKLK